MLDSLATKITEQFPELHKTCLKNILILSLEILQKETVCLNKIKSSLPQVTGSKSTNVYSHYKRLTRIFCFYSFSGTWLLLLKFVFQSLRLKVDDLLLDGTSWSRGKITHNFMVLSVVYNGISIPIYWKNLKRKGNSNQQNRKHLIVKAMKHFNLKGKILIADREYIGLDWFSFLLDQEISFVIRLRKKDYRDRIGHYLGLPISELEKKVLRSKIPTKSITRIIEINGMKLKYVIAKNQKDSQKEPLIYLLTDLNENGYFITHKYSIRWQIECCFKHLKSNGFDLEKINVKGAAKADFMMAVVVFTYTLSVLEGLKYYHKIRRKLFQNQKVYKEVSIFKKGLQELQAKIASLDKYLLHLKANIVPEFYQYRSPKSIFVQ